MRRFFLGICILIVCQTGCVSPEPVESTTSIKPYPLYRARPSTRLSGRRMPTVPKTRTPRPKRYRYAQTWFPKGRKISSRWTHIVLHHSATRRGSARAFDKNHREQNGWDELGYHFVIGNGTSTPDGHIEAGPRWHKQKHGAHCKTPDNYFNDHGIGICLVGDFTKTRPTRKQTDALNRLVQFLSAHCHIGPDRVTTHQSVTRKTECPGRYLQASAVRRSLKGRRAATVMP